MAISTYILLVSLCDFWVIMIFLDFFFFWYRMLVV